MTPRRDRDFAKPITVICRSEAVQSFHPECDYSPRASTVEKTPYVSLLAEIGPTLNSIRFDNH